MRIYKLPLLVLVSIVFITACEQKPKPNPTPLLAGENIAIADTESGKVRGYIHNGIFIYKGIPYAQAARFEGPQKVKPWTGVRSSMTYGPVAPLMDPTTAVQDESEFVFDHDWGYANEDCQRLNIWTPAIKGEANGEKKRPVMVWLHGGGYTAGSSQELRSYEGENLSRKGDVVVVTINHRLNILGFLNLSAYGDKYKTSANNSILDIVAALQWVKANIANFGGDPDNVLIFGQSGGGGKVNTLLNAPSAKGLFHKAVIQSGGLGLSFQSNESSQRISAALLTELKLKPEQVDSLQKVPFPTLVAAGRKAVAKVMEQMRAEGHQFGRFGLSWGPVLDGSFLPYQPTQPEAQAISANVPVMIGSTKNEFMTSLFMPQLRKAPLDSVNAHIKRMYGDKAEDFIAAVKKAYPNDTDPTDLIDIDAMFRKGALKMAEIKSASPAPVYMYLFSWQSPVLDGSYKSLHCMEIPFVFDNIARCEQMTGGTPEAYALADKVSQAWINFAYTGNPNHKGLPEWGAYKPENGITMIFDNTCEIKQHHDKDYLAIVPDPAI